MIPRILGTGGLGLLFTVQLAHADVAPPHIGIIHGPSPVQCESPPSMECITGGRSRREVESDECTFSEVKRLGFKFICGESHNDRLTTHWCRDRQSKLPIPDGFADELTAGSLADHYVEKHYLSPRNPSDYHPPSTDFDDCVRLAKKYARCGGAPPPKCADAWKRAGVVVSGGVPITTNICSGQLDTLECQTATERAEIIEADPITTKRLQASGLKFECVANDGRHSFFCRPKGMPPLSSEDLSTFALELGGGDASWDEQHNIERTEGDSGNSRMEFEDRQCEKYAVVFQRRHLNASRCESVWAKTAPLNVDATMADAASTNSASTQSAPPRGCRCDMTPAGSGGITTFAAVTAISLLLRGRRRR